MCSILAKHEAVCIMMLHTPSLLMHSIKSSPNKGKSISVIAGIANLPAAQRSEKGKRLQHGASFQCLMGSGN